MVERNGGETPNPHQSADRIPQTELTSDPLAIVSSDHIQEFEVSHTATGELERHYYRVFGTALNRPMTKVTLLEDVVMGEQALGMVVAA